MRANVGISPVYLSDNHLIAEACELGMVTGQMLQYGLHEKPAHEQNVPAAFSLGRGHMSFFRDKQVYLRRRHDELRGEMMSRGFRTTFVLQDLTIFHASLHNDWRPTEYDTGLLRVRITQRLKLKPHLYRYRGEYIKDIDAFASQMNNSELYYV